MEREGEAVSERVLVTGGTGVLGKALLPVLENAGYKVRAVARRVPAASDGRVEWLQADVGTGEGLARAVEGVDRIIHAATSPFKQTEQIEVGGTRNVLEAAGRAGVGHLLYVSIVGVDRVPLPYYKHKWAAEQVVEQGAVPWSIQRITQFHTLLDQMIGAAARLPVTILPTDFRFQPIAPEDAAEGLVEGLKRGPVGRLPDLGGPEVWTAGDLARAYLKARSLKRWLVRLPLAGALAAAFRAGGTTVPDRPGGRVRWEDWLRTRYAR